MEDEGEMNQQLNFSFITLTNLDRIESLNFSYQLNRRIRLFKRSSEVSFISSSRMAPKSRVQLLTYRTGASNSFRRR